MAHTRASTKREQELDSLKSDIRKLLVEKWKTPPSKPPWIAVFGPRTCGKTAFIENFFSVYGKPLPQRHSTPRQTQEYSLNVKEDQALLFREIQLDDQNPQILEYVRDVIDGKDPEGVSKRVVRPPPCFVVHLVAAHSSFADHDDELKMLQNVQRAIKEFKGARSCLLLTYTEKTKPLTKDWVTYTKQHGIEASSVYAVDISELRGEGTRGHEAAKGCLNVLKDIVSSFQELHEDYERSRDISGDRKRLEQPLSPQLRSPSARRNQRGKGQTDRNLPQSRQVQSDVLSTKSKPSANTCEREKDEDMHDPSRWLCAGKKADCCNWMDKCTDAHVIHMHIDTERPASYPGAPAQHKRSFRVSDEGRKHLLVVVNAILNSDASRGTVNIHLDGRFSNTFIDQVRVQLTKLISDDSSYDENFAKTHSKDGNHISFRVKPPPSGCRRPLSTMDFKTKLPSDTGIDASSQGNIRGVMQKVFASSKSNQHHSFPKDPPFKEGEVMPPWFVESTDCQMKAVPPGTLKAEPESSRYKDAFVKFATPKIIPYICAFSTLKNGGRIYVGFSQEKEVSTSGPGKTGLQADEGNRTGRFRCDGIVLTPEDRQYFETKLREQLDDMRYHSEEGQSPKECLVVSFEPVESKPERQNLVIVKIVLKPFSGIIWPDKVGPVAFKITDRLSSKIEKIPFEEWLNVFKNEDKEEE